MNTNKIVAKGLRDCSGKYNVYMPEIYSEILQSLRYCDCHQSDAFYLIGTIQKLVENGKEGVVWLGFSACGVDPRDRILDNLEDPRYRYYYRDLIGVWIRTTGSTIEVTLKHADCQQFMQMERKEEP